MKFFQVFTMIVMVLATVGVIGESGRGKHVYEVVDAILRKRRSNANAKPEKLREKENSANV